VARAQAADILIVKVQPLGGVRRATRIVEQAGLPAVVSSALDTSIGIGMATQLAGQGERLDHACGLVTGTVTLTQTFSRLGGGIGTVAASRPARNQVEDSWAS